MSRALLRFVRLSPTKARLIAKEVQGMNVEFALASLEFTANKAARLIAKVIASALANGGYDAKSAIVYSCRIDVGPVLKRFMPRARGRATPIRKPTSHIFVEILSKNEIGSLQTRKNTKSAIVTNAKTQVSTSSISKQNADSVSELQTRLKTKVKN